MGLNLDGAAVVDPDEQAEIESAFDIIADIERYLAEEMDVEAMAKPQQGVPDLSELTAEADTLSNEDLAVYLALFTQWASFIDYRLSVIVASHKLAERNRKLMDATIAMQLFTQGVAKTEVPIRTRHHPLHIKFEGEELKLYCMRKILEARYKAYSKQHDTISRLISLREQDLERQRIDANRPNRGKRGINRRKPLE